MLSNIDFPIAFTIIFTGTFLVGNIAFYLGSKKNWRSSSTRKFNHFGVSLISIILFSFVPLEHTTITAIFTSLGILIIYIISANSKHSFISSIMNSNIRDRDLPNGKFFVFLPLITGQVALYFCLITMNPILVKIAFCSMGFGDGLAEPIGTRYGKHTSQVKDFLWKKQNTKSLEGSAAVLVVSLLASFSLLYIYHFEGFMLTIAISIFYALFITFIEAISPRGLDNFLIILMGSLFLSFIVIT